MTPEEQRIIQALMGGQTSLGLPAQPMQPPPMARQPAQVPAWFRQWQQGNIGADNVFQPGAGTRVAQNIVPEDMTPKEYRDTAWDEQVADAYDKDAAKLALEWTAEGKNADVAKSVEQLREAQSKLESGADNLSGPLVGSWAGQQLAPIFNPDSVVTKEAIEEVVQRNLRLVLGAQFTEKEGERLISRAFNPKLQEPENAKRVGRLLTSIEDAAAAREAASQYFMKHGTLVGWNGKLPSMSDIEASIDDNGGDGWVTLPNGVRVREKR